MKQIILTQKYDSEHLLGKFLEHDAYDFVAMEDVDVYKPLGPGEEPNETNILMKFRKNVFPKELTDVAYDGLRHGASLSDNRGLAAGTHRDEFQTVPGGFGRRKWVTQRERALLQYFVGGSKSALGIDLIDEIISTTPDTPLEGRGGTKGGLIKGGAIWIVEKSRGFVFDDWLRDIRPLGSEQRKERAIEVLDMISDTTYGNSVNSGTAGFFDRYPRIPFCRETSWSVSEPGHFQKGYPLFDAASNVYRNNLPIRWNGQMEHVKKLKDDKWKLSDSVYTTVTINKDFRTACHRDAGDLCETTRVNNPAGFSNLTVLSNGKDFDGFYLCFPEYRVAAHIKPGDLIMMDAHCIHGNVPLISAEEGFERISVVMYFRTSMLDCGTQQYENLRKEFVYGRKNNDSHPDWRIGWNGITGGMWDSQEWFDYLAVNGYDSPIPKTSISVEDFM